MPSDSNNKILKIRRHNKAIGFFFIQWLFIEIEINQLPNEG